MKRHLVTFEPSKRQGYVSDETTLAEAARQLGVGLESVCGRRGACGKCVVRVEEGPLKKYGIRSGMASLSPPSDDERRMLDRLGAGSNCRLACLATVLGDVAVFVPEESRTSRRILHKAVAAKAIHLKPAVRNYYLQLRPPSLEDRRGDWERLADEMSSRFGLDNLTIDYPALRELQRAAREGGWRLTVSVWMGRHVVRVKPGLCEKKYGLAFDIGTTTVSGYLCDLEDGRVLASDSVTNPQVTYGEDVMSRITYADSNAGGLARLHAAIVEAMNALARDLTARVGLNQEDVLEAVVVGNTVMHHIALNVDPSPLGRAPFVPALQHSYDVKAREFGLSIHPGANVHFLPIEAGFVGADNVALLLTLEPHNHKEVWLIIDIGTNTELVLGNRQRLLCASCASGPALEGGHIRFGMRAAPGAIERVRIDRRSWEVSLTVVGQGQHGEEVGSQQIQAKGICGTGVIEAVAEMLAAGVIERSGRFNSSVSHSRLRAGENGPEFVLAWAAQTSIGKDITLSQRDIRAVALSKAAIYTGCKLLLDRMGVERPHRIILAGSFGSLVDPQRAMSIGMFPDIDLRNIHAVGNAAGDGARIALLNVDKRSEANQIARRVEHIDLVLEKEFQNVMMYALHFPHMPDVSQSP